MGDIVVEQELLLGYLMNVLDEDEVAEVERELARQPKLRGELAKLQKQISPLDILLETVDPPSDLTRRTCDNIWTTTQNDKFTDNIHLFPITESNSQTIITEKNSPIETDIQPQNLIAQFNPNPQLPLTIACFDSLEKNNICDSESINTSDNNSADGNLVRVGFDDAITGNNNCNDNIVTPVRINRRRSKQYTSDKQPPAKKSILRQLIISAVIGISIAVIIYPAINYFIGKVTQLVVMQKVQQLNKNVDVYAQLSDPSIQTSPEEIDLTRFGWQELIPSSEHIFAPNDNPQFIVTKILDNGKLPPSITNLIPANSPNQTSHHKEINNVTNSGFHDYLFLGQSGQFPVSFLSGAETHVANPVDGHV
ncbi:MAG: hypothetical protein LBC74_09075, partial [Planctomycetaceae bacterium]|nr:hypothetical protein [Planctomycetaceae bacterium]